MTICSFCGEPDEEVYFENGKEMVVLCSCHYFDDGMLEYEL